MLARLRRLKDAIQQVAVIDRLREELADLMKEQEDRLFREIKKLRKEVKALRTRVHGGADE